MNTPPCHLITNLETALPLCGADAVLATVCTMDPTLVTCPWCKKAEIDFKASSSPVETRRVSTLILEGDRVFTTKGSGKSAVSEQSLLREVRQLAQRGGYLCYHTWRSDRSEPGFPDVILAKPYHPLIAAELKTARGKLTRAQDMWLQCLRQVTGIEAHIWRPRDLDDIRDLLI